MTAITINFNHVVKLTNDQFYQLYRDDPDVKFERNAKGELIVMPVTGGETGKCNAKLTTQFVL
ncbi:MAG: Uma2 family endonuclease [Nostoc sp.]|uniref:Uma2 family endonuclease n=1 Tax=Nostoc sp. TaxID=1180 RepID=UPI002FF456FB